jgi:3-deoxy-manno-octulosonate cytidylyltransferase (CMP-KDO synthetase)
MKVMAIIPARLESTRFPGKVLSDVDGVPLVVHVLRRVQRAALIEKVVVATDSDVIRDSVVAHGGDVVLTKGRFSTGGDRVAAAARQFDADVFINVQADNGGIDETVVDDVARAFLNPDVQVVTPVCEFPTDSDPTDPSRVKAVVGSGGQALYFSRAPIPANGPWLLHIGVYGYRASALQRFAGWERGRLECIEDLEQLRFLENDTPIHTVNVIGGAIGVDTPPDLERLRQHLSTPTGFTQSVPRH